MDKTYMFDNYISIGRNFMIEKNYLKALKFFKKAYNCPEGKDDIDLILDFIHINRCESLLFTLPCSQALVKPIKKEI